jgi:hypothetical protein
MPIGKSKISDMDFGSFENTIDKNIETDKASDKFDIGISCIALLSEFTHKHATHCGCTCSQTCCITVFKLPKQ